VTEVDDFESIREIWCQILPLNIFGDEIFLSVDWLSNWWKHFGGKRKKLLLTLEEEGKIVGIAPLMLSRYKMSAFGSIRKIEFMGTRQSDYSNFILNRNEKDAIKSIIDYLEEHEDWDWIELKEIQENETYATQPFSSLSSGLDFKERVCNLCPYVTLPENFEVLKKSFSRNFRQNLNRYSKKLFRDHKVEFKRFDEAGFSVKEAMNQFIMLHQTKWHADGLPGAFADDTFREFHMDFAQAAARNRWLALSFLMVDGEPAAAQYNFDYNNKMYYYLGGFLPRYAEYSIGNLMIMFMLEDSIKKGLKEYDMTRGDEPYKLRWTNKYRRNFEVRLVHKKMASELYNWVTWGKTVESIAIKLGLSLKQTA